MSRKALIAESIEELVDDLTYYKRINDPDLPNYAIEQMVRDGEITVDEIVTMFKNTLVENLMLPTEAEVEDPNLAL